MAEEVKINILEHKYTQLRQWLVGMGEVKEISARLSIEQVLKMMDALDRAEGKMDEIILEAFADAK